MGVSLGPVRQHWLLSTGLHCWEPKLRFPGVSLFSLGPRGDPLQKIRMPLFLDRASLVARVVKNLPANAETPAQSLGRKDPLEKGMAAYSSMLVWTILQTEEPGRLQSMGLQELDTTEQLTLSFLGKSF